MVTNDNAEVVTIVARGADAVGSLHRYVTIIDSDGAVYLVGFGDATVPGYLTSDGQWGDGRDLPETMEYGSVMGAYYNDSTEGANNLKLLQVLASVGVSFASTQMVLNPNQEQLALFTPSYSCVDGALHVSNGINDLGWVSSEYSFLDEESEGPIDCEGGIGSTYPSTSSWVMVSNIELLVNGEELAEFANSWNTLIMIISGHINYVIPAPE